MCLPWRSPQYPPPNCGCDRGSWAPASCWRLGPADCGYGAGSADLRMPMAVESERSGQSSASLEALKEELFQLEMERMRGTVSGEEYDSAKRALDRTVKRALARAGTTSSVGEFFPSSSLASSVSRNSGLWMSWCAVSPARLGCLPGIGSGCPVDQFGAGPGVADAMDYGDRGQHRDDPEDRGHTIE
jgi:hypothetical protein